MKIKNKEITSRDEDFAKWYTDVVTKAELISYSGVKGFYVIEPRGYAIWEKIKETLDKMFKESGHQNVYLPLLMPESFLKKEAEHVEGFAPEVAWVTYGGYNLLEERYCIRPTSETLFCDYYANKIKSYRDLPKLYNQWCNIVRWEKETRPFLRSREILWQEGHTLHESEKEAIEETYRMLNIYKKLFEEYLAIPIISGKKTESEKFAGAEFTTTIEALMYDGRSLQCATSHYFGQKFSKPFNIEFLSKEGKLENPYQTSWGTATRNIGALIMVHGDDNGLILPPKIAPTQVAIIPISENKIVHDKAFEISTLLSKNNISNLVDDSKKSPGFRFSEHEMNGVPLRIEIGPRDLEKNEITLTRRDTYKKINIQLNDNIIEEIKELLNNIQENLFLTAKKRNESKTYDCFSLEEVKKIMMSTPGYIKAMWCGSKDCELQFKEIRGTKSRCIVENEKPISDTCICCGKKAKHLVYWGIQY